MKTILPVIISMLLLLLLGYAPYTSANKTDISQALDPLENTTAQANLTFDGRLLWGLLDSAQPAGAVVVSNNNNNEVNIPNTRKVLKAKKPRRKSKIIYCVDCGECDGCV
uniref:Hepcidin n=1 Tax=Cacopsylla melanoneura TaxID=428564 RepID=A0A8D8X529_9HEMI